MSSAVPGSCGNSRRSAPTEEGARTSPWAPRYSQLLTVETDRFVEVCQRRCGIRACRGAVAADLQHARIARIASPVGRESNLTRARIARRLGKLAERHRPAVRRGRDNPLRADTFGHPIVERLQRVEAVRRNPAAAMPHP